MIKIGDRVPGGTLYEYQDVPTEGCPVGPNAVDIAGAVNGKTIVVFAVPGAFTPTCSAKHLPGYLDAVSEFTGHGVDEIWCVSVNDPFVMGAWGRDQQVSGRIRLLSDGASDWTKALGLTIDLSARGFGVRSQRYSMLVKNGVVAALNIEQPGAFAVSDAKTMLEQLTPQHRG